MGKHSFNQPPVQENSDIFVEVPISYDVWRTTQGLVQSRESVTPQTYRELMGGIRHADESPLSDEEQEAMFAVLQQDKTLTPKEDDPNTFIVTPRETKEVKGKEPRGSGYGLDQYRGSRRRRYVGERRDKAVTNKGHYLGLAKSFGKTVTKPFVSGTLHTTNPETKQSPKNPDRAARTLIRLVFTDEQAAREKAQTTSIYTMQPPMRSFGGQMPRSERSPRPRRDDVNPDLDAIYADPYYAEIMSDDNIRELDDEINRQIREAKNEKLVSEGKNTSDKLDHDTFQAIANSTAESVLRDYVGSADDGTVLEAVRAKRDAYAGRKSSTRKPRRRTRS